MTFLFDASEKAYFGLSPGSIENWSMARWRVTKVDCLRVADDWILWHLRPELDGSKATVNEPTYQQASFALRSSDPEHHLVYLN